MEHPGLAVEAKPDLQGELQERLRFETLLTEILSRLVSSPSSRVDSEIERALSDICTCLSIDHASFWEVSLDDSAVAEMTHLHRDPELPPVPKLVAREVLPWAEAKIRSGEVLAVPDTENVPQEAGIDKETWRRYGVKSILGIPLSVGGGAVIGAVVFDAIREKRDWPESLSKRLSFLAQAFASTINRKNTDRKLQESEARLSLAADSANAGLWIWDPVSGHTWATEKNFELLGLPPATSSRLSSFLRSSTPTFRK